MISIAVLLTCFNRKEKTISCLESLFKVKDEFVKSHSENDLLSLEVFLTDDGCTDGTADAVRNNFSNQSVNIIQGDGNLFWAGGMRFCWREALKRHKEWDYYLLLNDDTILRTNVFEELFNSEEWAVVNYGKKGIVSGITSASDDLNRLTYGGDVWVNRFMAKQRRLLPTGMPQICDLTNANIFLVPREVVDEIGIFYDGYRHGMADYDYSYRARKNDFPVVLTANFCGICDNDHVDYKQYAAKILGMTFKERKAFFRNPIHSSRDYLRFIWRTAPFRWPLVWVGRKMNEYIPKLYYTINGVRMK